MEYKCLDGESTNQITEYNIIKVIAGSMESLPEYPTTSFAVETAFVIFDDTRRFEYYDVGVLRSGINIFYDANLNDDEVGSICLPSTDLDFSKEMITFVGWGSRYSELPVAEKEKDRNPTHTSCATSEVAPTNLGPDDEFLEARYKRCDVAFMKENKWGCKKLTSWEDADKFPPAYPVEKCFVYWEQADEAVKKLVASDPETFEGYDQIFANIKKIEVLEQPDCLGYKVECFRPDLLFEHGWCNIEGDNGGPAWGICDTSCELAPVMTNTYLSLLVYKSFLNLN